MQVDENYKQIPLEVAEQIGKTFEKCSVVIIALDKKYECIHVTTWGDCDYHQAWARGAGEISCEAIGGDVKSRAVFSPDGEVKTPPPNKAGEGLKN